MLGRLKRLVGYTMVATLCLIMVGGACLAEASAGPELNVQIQKTDSGQFVLSGTTDGSGVSIEKNGAEIDVTLLDMGFYVSKSFAIEMGDSVTVRAWDEAGNDTEQSFGVSPKPDGEIGEVWPLDDGAHNSVGTLELQGWYAVHDEDAQVEVALYRVEWTVAQENGRRVERETLTAVGEPIDLSGKTQMSDRELAVHARLWPKETDVAVGYNFYVEVPMHDFGITQTGQYRLLLRWYDPNRNYFYEIGRCEPPFIVRAWPDWIIDE